jgi:hypothetical protein
MHLVPHRQAKLVVDSEIRGELNVFFQVVCSMPLGESRMQGKYRRDDQREKSLE